MITQDTKEWMAGMCLAMGLRENMENPFGCGSYWEGQEQTRGWFWYLAHDTYFVLTKCDFSFLQDKRLTMPQNSLYISLRLDYAGHLPPGKILAFMTYFTIILNAMMSISRMFVIISKAVASAARIDQVLGCGEDLALLGETEALPEENEEAEEIVFEHVVFSYNKNEPNLKDISFTVKKGEMLGIIGSTGSGKTTLAALLMRLMDADEGRVLIGGRDVRSFDKEELRSRFGVVFQNDTIFEDTIYENVRMGRALDGEAIGRALHYAQAEEFTEEKVKNEGAMLDIRGANLSGGQKQRVLIARALAAGPEILILDDSSSALDYRTDALLRRQLREHFRGTTTILIAQRISSVMHADHILVLEDGEMIGYGTHEELMKTCKVYQEIYESQTKEAQEA